MPQFLSRTRRILLNVHVHSQDMQTINIKLFVSRCGSAQTKSGLETMHVLNMVGLRFGEHFQSIGLINQSTCICTVNRYCVKWVVIRVIAWITGWRPLNGRLGLRVTVWLRAKVRERELYAAYAVRWFCVVQRRYSCIMWLVAQCKCLCSFLYKTLWERKWGLSL